MGCTAREMGTSGIRGAGESCTWNANGYFGRRINVEKSEATTPAPVPVAAQIVINVAPNGRVIDVQSPDPKLEQNKQATLYALGQASLLIGMVKCEEKNILLANGPVQPMRLPFMKNGRQ